MTEQPFDSPVGAHVDHRSMLVKAWQLIGGEYVCYCGEPAVMELRTQPDAEPGLVCKRHGLEWLGAVFRLYGAEARSADRGVVKQDATVHTEWCRRKGLPAISDHPGFDGDK